MFVVFQIILESNISGVLCNLRTVNPAKIVSMKYPSLPIHEIICLENLALSPTLYRYIIFNSNTVFAVVLFIGHFTSLRLTHDTLHLTSITVHLDLWFLFVVHLH